MRITFRGVRGSIPTPLTPAAYRERARALIVAARAPRRAALPPDELLAALPPGLGDLVGGNTLCFEVRAGKRLIVFDAGTGIRSLGYDLMETEFGRGRGALDLFQSHTHWDHMIGFPFFLPAFIMGNSVRIRSPFARLEERYAMLFRPEFFPVPWKLVRSQLRFERIAEGKPCVLDDVTVTPRAVPHPGGCYAYRVEHAGKSFVFATDVEWAARPPRSKRDYDALFRDADLVVFDSAYTEEEAVAKAGWGHSAPSAAVALALRAGVKRLALFHHDPASNDEQIAAIAAAAEAHRRAAAPASKLEIAVAREGMVVEL